MSRLLGCALAILASSCFLTPVAAQDQAADFVYIGRLELDGKLADGHFDLSFSLWDAEAGGEQIGAPITANAHPIRQGVISIRLAFPGAFIGEQRFVQIEVNGQMLPRSPITAAPVAQWTLGGTASSAGPAGPEGPAGESHPCHGLAPLEFASIDGVPEAPLLAGETFEISVGLARGGEAVTLIRVDGIGVGPRLEPGPEPHQLSAEPSFTLIGKFSYILVAADACGTATADFAIEVRP